MGLRLAVIGATGLVGRRLLAHIEAEKQLGPSDLHLYASSDSAGTRIDYRNWALPIADLAACDFSHYDAAFFCVGDELSAEYVPQALAADCAVIDKSNAFRMKPAIPLVVAGVNEDVITADSILVANPNCTTMILAHALAPLARTFGLTRVFAATYQSVSGAGAAAVEKFEQQLKAAPPATQVASTELDPSQFAFNVIPAVGGFDAQGRCSEETKLVDETRKVLGKPRLPIIAHTVRVPVAVGHSIAVTVELDKPARADAIIKTWLAAPDVEYLDDAFPSPLTAQRHNAVEVGRLRPEPDLGNGFSFFISGDNVNIGAALNGWRIFRRMQQVGAVLARAAA